MFGLTPITLYAIIGLLISNVMFVGLWQFADSRADKQEALVVACQAKHQAFVEQTEAARRNRQGESQDQGATKCTDC